MGTIEEDFTLKNDKDLLTYPIIDSKFKQRN